MSTSEYNISSTSVAAWLKIGEDLTVGNGAYSVSMNSAGNIVAIGLPEIDTVKIYSDNNGSWEQIGEDIVESASVSNEFGWSVSLNSTGDIVAIGSPIFVNDAGLNQRYVTVYQNNNGTWEKIGANINLNAASDGFAVEMSGDGSIVAIGTPTTNYSNINARVFKNISGTWTQIGGDVNAAAGEVGTWGYDISLNYTGNILVLGSYRAGANNSGRAKVFENISGTWTQIGQDITGLAAYEYFGAGVGLNDLGDIIAIGAPTTGQGKARVYQNISGTWTQIGQDINGGPYFGGSICLNSAGDIVLIGSKSPWSVSSASVGGPARVYQNNNGIWEEIGSTVINGYTVSMNSAGDRFIAGDPSTDGDWAAAFELGIEAPTPTPTPTSTPSATPSSTPSATPSSTPSAIPTSTPSAIPTSTPSATPTSTPSATPPSTPPSTTYICSRFIFNEHFDLYQDIYVSFETTSIIDVNNGLVVFISEPGIEDDLMGEPKLFLPGDGLGILYPKSQPLLPTGHLISVALDGIGNYGLANTYAGSERRLFGPGRGVSINTPHSITTRVARNTIPFEHLNTSSTIDELKSTTPNIYRFRFKGYLNKVYVDILQDGEYYNIYTVDTNVNINDISRTGQVGFSYSGLDQFGIKNVTYSAVIADIAPPSTPAIAPSPTPAIAPSSTPAITPSATPAIAPSSTPAITPSASVLGPTNDYLIHEDGTIIDMSDGQMIYTES